MHEAAALVLGDLDVGGADLALELLLRDLPLAGERARDVDRRVAPQRAERVVPDHRARVVEALQAQRLTETRIALLVASGAGERHAVRAHRPIAARTTWRGRPSAPSARVCTGPKLGAVSVKNTAGCSMTVSGTPLPPLSPAVIRW